MENEDTQISAQSSLGEPSLQKFTDRGKNQVSLNINKENKLPRDEGCVFGNVIITGGRGSLYACCWAAGISHLTHF